ncbi:MAG: hypothetical protein O7D30_13065, partial [Rickettsia endosymbiont of Ixodes persulcatus]|nr:hypothetical protein [Rickettsia endosymbiont of Ixodes persulcatus]
EMHYILSFVRLWAEYTAAKRKYLRPVTLNIQNDGNVLFKKKRSQKIKKNVPDTARGKSVAMVSTRT